MAEATCLVCWGGKDGNAVTITLASPAVATIASGTGLVKGIGLVLSTTGALPTGLTAGTTYYAGNIGATTFNFYDTEANAITGDATGRVDTSGSQSGIHTATSAYWNGLTTAQKARYGTAGSERAYNGLVAWKAARNGVPAATDNEIVEIGEAFLEVVTADFNPDISAGSVVIHTKVNGIRSGAFHNKTYPSSLSAPSVLDGYVLRNATYGRDPMTLTGFNLTFDGNIVVQDDNIEIPSNQTIEESDDSMDSVEENEAMLPDTAENSDA